MSRLDDWNFYGDARVRAAHRQRWYERIDEHAMTAVVEICNDDGEEVELKVPFKWEVCDLCDGRGKHVNPSIDAGGISPEDFDAEPGFHEDYLAGVYDVACYECKGRRVVPVVDPEKADKDTIRLIEQRERDRAQWAAEELAERRMGA